MWVRFFCWCGCVFLNECLFLCHATPHLFNSESMSVCLLVFFVFFRSAKLVANDFYIMTVGILGISKPFAAVWFFHEFSTIANFLFFRIVLRPFWNVMAHPNRRPDAVAVGFCFCCVMLSRHNIANVIWMKWDFIMRFLLSFSYVRSQMSQISFLIGCMYNLYIQIVYVVACDCYCHCMVSCFHFGYSPLYFIQPTNFQIHVCIKYVSKKHIGIVLIKLYTTNSHRQMKYIYI